MGFKRRRNWGTRDERKGRARPKLALIGAIVLAVGILSVLYGGNIKNYNVMVYGGMAIIPGGLMLMFSLSKRDQIRFAKGVDRTREIFKDSCQCCKCQNCGRSHNHWTHDDDDNRRRHY